MNTTNKMYHKKDKVENNSKPMNSREFYGTYGHAFVAPSGEYAKGQVLAHIQSLRDKIEQLEEVVDKTDWDSYSPLAVTLLVDGVLSR